jgi:MFS family permease
MSVLVGITQGLGVNMIAANLPAIQGTLGASPVEANWLVTAYSATSVSASLLLIKFRYQYGLRLFADLGLVLFLLVTAAHLLSNDLRSAIAVRAAQGIAAAPLSTLSLLYMIQAFPPERRNTGVALGMAASQLAVPLSRVISPDLLTIGRWHGLYLFELGLALICLAGVNLFRLAPLPRVRMFEPMDVVSFGLFAPGLALLCIVLGQGRLLWWTEARWLGLCLAGAVALLSAATLVELHRKRPLIDVRWLSSGDMARFAIAIVLFRIVLSEQSTGVVGLLQTLGLIPDQLLPLYWIILVATVAGFVTAALTVNPERVLTPLMISLVLIAAGSFLDARSTSLVRPVNFFLTQGMTAFAAALFLPPAMLFGVSRAFARGPYHLVGFATVFGAGQTLGGLAGSALVGSFVTVRERFHFNTIADHLVLSDPQVAARVRQLAGVYGRVLTDRVQLGAEGVQLLLQRATREAYVRAYDDAFVLLGAMATLVLLWFVALRTRRILQERRAAREQPA